MSFLALQSPSPRRRSSFTSQRSPSATRRVNRGSQWRCETPLETRKKQRGSLISCDLIWFYLNWYVFDFMWIWQVNHMIFSHFSWFYPVVNGRELRTEVICGGLIRLHSFPSYGTCWNMYLTGGFKCYCSFIIRTSCLTLNECALCSYGLEKHQGQLGLGPGDLQLAIEHTRSLKVAKKNMATILEKNISSHGSSNLKMVDLSMANC